MGGDDIAGWVVSWVLHGTEVVDLLILRNDHHAAGVLTGGALHSGTAGRQTGHLRLAGGAKPLLQILFYVTEGGLFCHRPHRPRTKHVGLAKQLECIAVCVGLIFSGEVQVNIGHFVAAEAEEGLEGNVKAVLGIGCATLGTHRIGHIRAAAVGMLGILRVIKVGVLAVGAAVVGRQRVDLGNA